VINAGVIGYTSYQGMKLLDTQVIKWSPDLVIAYFGWNDHWLARGVDDKQQSAEQPSGLLRLLSEIRVFQLASLVTSGAEGNRVSKMRVEPDDYHDNLTQMQRRCRQGGAEMWLVTAPHAMDLGVPPYLLSSGEVSSLETLVPLHEQYNEIVRRVGQQTQAAVIDVATEMDGMNKEALFIEDHIHLSDLGKQYLVRRLLQTLAEQGILETPASEPAESQVDVEAP
jgi:lysophospholipase L1-like esterase